MCQISLKKNTRAEKYFLSGGCLRIRTICVCNYVFGGTNIFYEIAFYLTEKHSQSSKEHIHCETCPKARMSTPKGDNSTGLNSKLSVLSVARNSTIAGVSGFLPRNKGQCGRCARKWGLCGCEDGEVGSPGRNT